MEGRQIRLLDGDTGAWQVGTITALQNDAVLIQMTSGRTVSTHINDPMIDWGNYDDGKRGSDLPEEDNILHESQLVARRADDVGKELATHQGQEEFVRQYQLPSMSTYPAGTDAVAGYGSSLGSIGDVSAPAGEQYDSDFGRSQYSRQASAAAGPGTVPGQSLTAPSNYMYAMHGSGSAEDDGDTALDGGSSSASHSGGQSLREHSNSPARAPRGQGAVPGPDQQGRVAHPYGHEQHGGNVGAGQGVGPYEAAVFHTPERARAGLFDDANANRPRLSTTQGAGGWEGQGQYHVQQGPTQGSPAIHGQGHIGAGPQQVVPYPAGYSYGFCRPYTAAESIASWVLQVVLSNSGGEEGIASPYARSPVAPARPPVSYGVAGSAGARLRRHASADSAPQGLLAGTVLGARGLRSLPLSTSRTGRGGARVFVRVCLLQTVQQSAAESSPAAAPSPYAFSTRLVPSPKAHLPYTASAGSAKARGAEKVQAVVSRPGTDPRAVHPQAAFIVKPELRVNPLTARRTPLFRTASHPVNGSAGSTSWGEVEAGSRAGSSQAGSPAARRLHEGRGPAPTSTFVCSIGQASSTVPSSPGGFSSGGLRSNRAAGGSGHNTPPLSPQAASEGFDWTVLRGYLLFQIFEERESVANPGTAQNLLMGQALLRLCDLFAAAAGPHTPEHSALARHLEGTGQAHSAGLSPAATGFNEPAQEFCLNLWLPLHPSDAASGGSSSPSTSLQSYEDRRMGYGQGQGQAGDAATAAVPPAIHVSLSLVLPRGVVVPVAALEPDGVSLLPTPMARVQGRGAQGIPLARTRAITKGVASPSQRARAAAPVGILDARRELATPDRRSNGHVPVPAVPAGQGSPLSATSRRTPGLPSADSPLAGGLGGFSPSQRLGHGTPVAPPVPAARPGSAGQPLDSPSTRARAPGVYPRYLDLPAADIYAPAAVQAARMAEGGSHSGSTARSAGLARSSLTRPSSAKVLNRANNDSGSSTGDARPGGPQGLQPPPTPSRGQLPTHSPRSAATRLRREVEQSGSVSHTAHGALFVPSSSGATAYTPSGTAGSAGFDRGGQAGPPRLAPGPAVDEHYISGHNGQADVAVAVGDQVVCLAEVRNRIAALQEKMRRMEELLPPQDAQSVGQE